MMAAAVQAPWERFVGRHVVLLFVDHRERTGQVACRTFESMGWPVGYERRVIDVQQEPEVAGFFGIRTTPCIAIVVDGSLAAVEHECNEGSCASLLEQARRSYEDFLRTRV